MGMHCELNVQMLFLRAHIRQPSVWATICKMVGLLAFKAYGVICLLLSYHINWMEPEACLPEQLWAPESMSNWWETVSGWRGSVNGMVRLASA